MLPKGVKTHRLRKAFLAHGHLAAVVWVYSRIIQGVSVIEEREGETTGLESQYSLRACL